MKHLIGQLTKFFLPLSLLVLFSSPLEAQRAAGSVGIGGQFGNPSGLTLKIYQPTGLSTDILAAWDLDDFFFINVHGLLERAIDRNHRVHYFVGPGFFLGLRDNSDEIGATGNDDFAAGLSGSLGLNVILGKIELYAQVTPRLQIIDETDTDIGGGVGVRFYFR